jgi:hypothetical protein
VTVAGAESDGDLLGPGISRALVEAVGGVLIVTRCWDSDAATVALFVDGACVHEVRFPVAADDVPPLAAAWREVLGDER